MQNLTSLTQNSAGNITCSKNFTVTGTTTMNGTVDLKGLFIPSGTATQAICVGTSASKITLTAGSPHFEMYTTCASTNGSTSAEPFLVNSTMTGAGGVGGRAKFYMTTNVALGGWSNALKSHVVYGANGSTTGLGSSFCAEMDLSAGTSSGTYAPLGIELNLGSGASTGTRTSFIHCSTQGDGVAAMDGAGFFFTISGVSSGATNLWYDHQGSAPANVEEWLRVKTPGGTRYLALYDAVV